MVIDDKGEDPDIIYIDVTINQDNVSDCYTALTLDKLQEAGGVKLYPNPNDGFFTLEVYNLIPGEDVSVSILSMVGERVFLISEIAGGMTLTSNLNLSFLSRGTYFVRVARESGISVHKLIIL
jgi:hypothetical protein